MIILRPCHACMDAGLEAPEAADLEIRAVCPCLHETVVPLCTLHGISAEMMIEQGDMFCTPCRDGCPGHHRCPVSIVAKVELTP